MSQPTLHRCGIHFRSWVLSSTTAALLAVAFLSGAPAQAAPPSTFISFDGDLPGPVPNGFTSADSDRIAFSDSRGRDLEIDDFGSQSRGVGLATFHDDASALVMQLRRPARSLSLAFGNDDPGYSNPGDRAVLTLFLNDRRVGQVSVVMNRDDRPNQRIGYEGHPFDRAVFLYDVSVQGGLIEIVDDVRAGL